MDREPGDGHVDSGTWGNPALGSLSATTDCLRALNRQAPRSDASLDSDSDPRVVQALEEYMAACERGFPPDRKRFLDRHSAIADSLTDCLDGLECLQRAGTHFLTPHPEHSGSPSFGAGGDQRTPQRLGDYQLIREIGRGGMGVVFEAEQISLGRRVAIKLLPFSGAIDPRQVQRFQVEVQAAAHLHHPHIVPIYAVGCESGTHYFAMQLISGKSLGALISALRETAEARRAYGGKTDVPSTLREGRESAAARATEADGPEEGHYEWAAGLGIQAAEALDHAHGLGVIHRDIKPANLLVETPNRLWVADFGLARLQGDSGPTATGDLVGTLRYMSPEQALAHRGVVDHRTDIYSLGATLYELLTLRQVFQGTDLPTLVYQVCNEHPTPPRKIDPRIPHDLETIILKAMAKEPVHRYATARELAEDLKRFRMGKPVLVSRPSLAERATWWARRHRGVVFSSGVVLVLALFCLSICTVMVWSAMNRTAQVSRGREIALNRAQANLSLAHRALDLCLNSAESWFPRDPGGDPLDGELLKSALAYYEQIATQNTSPEVVFQTVAAYGRVGDIRVALGEPFGAETAYRKALDILVDVVAKTPGDPRIDRSFAAIMERYGNILRKYAMYLPAEWYLAESIRHYEEVVQSHPADSAMRLALARVLNQTASLKGETGRIAPALEESRRALGLLESLRTEPGAPAIDPLVLEQELASIYSNLGKWLHLDNKVSEAEAAYRQSLEMLQHIRSESPGTPATRESLAVCQAMLGELYRVSRRNQDAEPLLVEAIRGLERLSADYPGVPRYKEDLSRFHVVLANLYWTTGRFREASESRRYAMKFDPRLHHGQQTRLNNLAWYLLTVPNLEDRKPDRALELACRAIELAPESWESWNTLGVAYYRTGNWEESRDALRLAIEKHKGENAYDGYFLAMVMWRLGDRHAARDWLARADHWRQANLPDDAELLRFRAEAELLVGPTGDGYPPKAPALPETVAAALRDRTFGLPRRIVRDVLPYPVETQSETRTSKAKASPPRSLRVFEALDHALYFLDLTSNPLIRDDRLSVG